jgi:hypothetical protein
MGWEKKEKLRVVREKFGDLPNFRPASPDILVYSPLTMS